MGALRGALVGSAGLVALYNLVTADQPGLTGAAKVPGAVAHWLISPDVPLIPDLRPAPTPNFPNGNPDGALPHVNPDGSIPAPGSGVTPGIPSSALPVPTGQGAVPV